MNNKHKGKGFKKDFGKKGGSWKVGDFRKFEESKIPEKVNLGDVNLSLKGDSVEVLGIVNRITQTGGPTIFNVGDGYGSLALKGFESPGSRAHPDINEGDLVSAVVDIGEYNGVLEGEIKKIHKLSEKEAKIFNEGVEKKQREFAKVESAEFLGKSIILDKLKDRFFKAAEEIRLAVIQERPIIVRHHNDTDGYSSGFALELAIRSLIIDKYGSKAGQDYFTRAPCRAPMYEIDDSIIDAANALRNVSRFSDKIPLVIIADNGSSPEDLFAIKHGKVHGMQFIVVDHHGFDEDVISEEVLVHINPFLVKEDGSHISAGMLCAELARFINDKVNVNFIPAMAGIADRIDINNKELVEQYIKIAEADDYSRDLLNDIITVIDFVSTKVRFMEAREYIEVVFGQPRKSQKQLVRLMASYIRKLEKKGLEIAKSTVQSEMIGKTKIQYLDIEKNFPGFGFYPKPGMCVGMIHDYAKENGDNNLISMGLMNTAITFRATDEAGFSVHELIGHLNKKLPNAFVEGGGHKNAGSISFIPLKKDAVLEEVKGYIGG